ncbi:hypothetical protein Hanom_Chr06g00524441 [Helianthus anomalus]
MPHHLRIRSDDVEPMTLSPISLKINNPSKKKHKQQIYIYREIAYRAAVFLSLSMKASHFVGCCFVMHLHHISVCVVFVCVFGFGFGLGWICFLMHKISMGER